MDNEFDGQFLCQPGYYLEKLDIIDWLRYFRILKVVLKYRPARTLEIGPGHGLMKKMLGDITAYTTMDVNNSLSPDIVGDIRVPNAYLAGKYDCIIASQVLEHIPFSDIPAACQNLGSYLAPEGCLILTVPHRRSNFLFMSPANILRVWTLPTGFLSFGAFYRRFIKGKVWIDPHHCWEIGDGNVTREDFERTFPFAGLIRLGFEKLFYSDMWVLKKEGPTNGA